jgi:hypothetical protein
MGYSKYLRGNYLLSKLNKHKNYAALKILSAFLFYLQTQPLIRYSDIRSELMYFINNFFAYKTLFLY